MEDRDFVHLDFNIGTYESVFGFDINDDMSDEFPKDEVVDHDQASGSAATSAPEINADNPTGASFRLDDQGKSRFAKVDDKGLQQIIEKSNSKSTGRSTAWGVKLFREWLLQRQRPSNYETFGVEQLNDCLRLFYAEVRNVHGEFYSKTTMVGLRAAINRHLRSPPYERDICLMSDKAFHTANNVFLSIIRNLKRDGLDETHHHAAIPATEIRTIRESFNQSSSVGLLRKVWFDLTLGFARRGNENQRELRSSSFRVSSDEDGFEFIEMTHSELTKNHRGDLKDSVEPNRRIYATDGEFCPLASFKRYVSRMNPENPNFFQQPKTKISLTDTVWYTSRPVGKNSLASFMKDISKAANLPHDYTNHCLRATAVTLLSHAGIENREICKITGHKNDQSLKLYSTESSTSQKRSYSAILQGAGNEYQVLAASNAPQIRPFSNHKIRSSVNSSMGMLQIHNSTVKC